MDEVADIKDRLGVEEVVGSYVQLRPAGRNLKGLCPFHQEKTPSFIVSPEKGIYHCFGCAEGGDIFTFVQKMEGFDFVQALENLALRAGVELPERGRGTGENKQHKQRLYEALTAAAQYYHIQLSRHQPSREYVTQQRGFNTEIIKQFKLGWAPAEGRQLVRFLSKQGYNERELLDAGLARRKNQQLHDLFRARVAVPFFDTQGRIIGFTGRVLEDSPAGGPKYLNTPSTRLFDKSRFIFGLYQAKEQIRIHDEAVLVEGNLDVLASHQAGASNVVALSGTALTLPQLKQLGRLSQNLTLAFDADAAGLKATERALPLAQTAGVVISIVTLPAGQDPDDVIRSDPEAWPKLLAQKTYAVDWLFQALASNYDPASAPGKKALTDRALETLRRLEDPVEREHYVKALAALVGAAPGVITEKLHQIPTPTAPRSKGRAAPSAARPPRDEFDTVATALLALAAAYPDTRSALEDIAANEFEEPLGNIISHLKSDAQPLAPAKLPKALQPSENYVKILLLRGEEEYGSWVGLDRQVEAFSLSHRLLELKTKRRKQQLSSDIAVAETAGDKELRDQLLHEFKSL